MIDLQKLEPVYKTITDQYLSSPAIRNPWFLWVYIGLTVIVVVWWVAQLVSEMHDPYDHVDASDIFYRIVQMLFMVGALAFVYFGLLCTVDNHEEVSQLKQKALWSYVETETGVKNLECDTDGSSCVFSVDGEFHRGGLEKLEDGRYAVLIDDSTGRAVQVASRYDDGVAK